MKPIPTEAETQAITLAAIDDGVLLECAFTSAMSLFPPNPPDFVIGFARTIFLLGARCIWESIKALDSDGDEQKTQQRLASISEEFLKHYPDLCAVLDHYKSAAWGRLKAQEAVKRAQKARRQF